MKWILLILVCLGSNLVRGQVVDILTTLETNRIPVGGATLLHVYAQVNLARRADSDQLLLWYVDILNGEPLIARLNFGSLVKPVSDRDPRISSVGVLDGGSLRGIYDSFFNLPGAGVTNRVELLRLTVTGVSAGQTTFAVGPGSGVNLANDFTVVPLSDSPPLTGGIYSTNATANLTVFSGSVVPNADVKLSITLTNTTSPPNPKLLISFNPVVGVNHFIEFRGQIDSTTPWQVFPGAPHNTGILLEPNNLPSRFYRVRSNPP